MSVEEKINKTQDVEYIKYLISLNPDINNIIMNKYDSEEKIKILLDNGLPPYKVHYSNDIFNIIKPYLNKDNVLVEIEKGINLFIKVIYGDNIENVKYLISLGVDVNFSCKQYFYPVRVPVLNDNFEIFKLLLDNGADHKNTFSLKMNNKFRREIYSRMKDINEADFEGKTLLYNAIKMKDYDLAKELIARKAVLPTLCEVPDILFEKKFIIKTEEDKFNAIKELLYL